MIPPASTQRPAHLEEAHLIRGADAVADQHLPAAGLHPERRARAHEPGLRAPERPRARERAATDSFRDASGARVRCCGSVYGVMEMFRVL